VDNLWLAGSLVFGARAASQRWTGSTIAQTAHWKGHAEFRSRFCFAPDGWLEGGG